MISKQDSENLLKRLSEGIQHRKEVKNTRSNHKCHGSPCKLYSDSMIRIGEPAIVITNEITVNNRTIFTKPKYYHTICELQ